MQPIASRSIANEVDNHCIADQGTTAPVLGDVAKQPVFDLVPLARPGREMADTDLQTRFVGKPLQGEFPETVTVAIASSRVHRDEQFGGIRIGGLTQPLPPTTQ